VVLGKMRSRTEKSPNVIPRPTIIPTTMAKKISFRINSKASALYYKIMIIYGQGCNLRVFLAKTEGNKVKGDCIWIFNM